MLMEDRAEGTVGTKVVDDETKAKSKSLDVQSLYVEKSGGNVGKMSGVKRKWGAEPQKYKPFINRCVVHGNLEKGSLREVGVKSGLPATTSIERLEFLDDKEHILSIRIIGGDHRLKNYSSIVSLHPVIIDGRSGTMVIESFVVDVPEGNTKDETVAKHGVPIGPRAYSYWLYEVPWGLYKAINYIKEFYGNPIMILSENGRIGLAIRAPVGPLLGLLFGLCQAESQTGQLRACRAAVEMWEGHHRALMLGIVPEKRCDGMVVLAGRSSTRPGLLLAEVVGSGTPTLGTRRGGYDHDCGDDGALGQQCVMNRGECFASRLVVARLSWDWPDPGSP
ncbi:hypothetical protein Droror1_Dr00025671 [Drosera rotundifolia]